MLYDDIDTTEQRLADFEERLVAERRRRASRDLFLCLAMPPGEPIEDGKLCRADLQDSEATRTAA